LQESEFYNGSQYSEHVLPTDCGNICVESML
jgi:hypothetical protein